MASVGSTSHTIQGVKVEFPCKPYPSQLSMMYKIICGLEKKQNCLLESPTGSGKSLALLCAALAWQKAQYEKAKAEETNGKKEAESCCQCSSSANFSPSGAQQQSAPLSIVQTTSPGLTNVTRPVFIGDSDENDFKPSGNQIKILKTVRGHVTPAYEDSAPEHPMAAGSCCTCQEQGNCGKKKIKVPKIYFGTRTHKQIAQITRELKKTAYKHVRMCILASREHTCVDRDVSVSSNKSEDCKLKIERHGCRYKDGVRKVSHSKLPGFGLHEAWDLEDFVEVLKNQRACPYFGARELKDQADIIFCPYNYLVDPVVRNSMEINLNEQVVILDEAHNIEDSAREAASYTVTVNQLNDGLNDLRNLVRDKVNPTEHGVMQDLLLGALEVIESNKASVGGGNFDDAHKVLQGYDIMAALSHAKIGVKEYQNYRNAFSKLLDQDAEKGAMENVVKMKGVTSQVIDGLLTVLNYLFKPDLPYLQDYRVAILRTMSFIRFTPDDYANRWASKKQIRNRREWTYSLNFWSMNPAVAFSDISSVVRSIVLTSGTLSPMNSFQSELGAPFEIQLEAAHVIGKSQVWVGTISRGPKGGSLLGSYQSSETYAYQDELGQLVLDVCEDTGLWQQLQNHKTVMTEPKASDKVDFDKLMKQFYDIIRDSESEEGGKTGALFMAVCRGKVSEGMDFTDNNARAVIAVGIPFPNIKDTQVNLKKAYNCEHSGSRGLLSGNDWYEIQAYRALNQALGRCIRHRHDWGALILVDERYAKNPNKYTKGLSKWVRQRIQYYGYYPEAFDSLKEYTQKMLESPPVDQSNISMFETTMDETMNRELSSGALTNSVTPAVNETPSSTIRRILENPVEASTSLVNHAVPAAPARPSLVKIGEKLYQLCISACGQQYFVAVQQGAVPDMTIMVPIQTGAQPILVKMTRSHMEEPVVTVIPGALDVAQIVTPPSAKIFNLPDGSKVVITLQDMGRQNVTVTNTIIPPAVSIISSSMEKHPPLTSKTMPGPQDHLPPHHVKAEAPLSQAGGFLPSQTQGDPVPTQSQNIVLDTTVVKGSLGSTQGHGADIMDFPDDLDLEFNPSIASTQQIPSQNKVIPKTPTSAASKLLSLAAMVGTPPVGQSILKGSGFKMPQQPGQRVAKVQEQDNGNVRVVLDSPPPLFDSESQESEPMDSGFEIYDEAMKRLSAPDLHKKQPVKDGKKSSITEDPVSVKHEVENNSNNDAPQPKHDPNCTGRKRKPLFKTLPAGTRIEGSLSHSRLSRKGRQSMDDSILNSSRDTSLFDEFVDTSITESKAETDIKTEYKAGLAGQAKLETERSSSKRRRQTITPTSQNSKKKAKGVVFSDDSSDEKKDISCVGCGCELVNEGTDLQRKDLPKFMKCVQETGGCFLTDAAALTDTCTAVTAMTSDIQLDSHWSETENCVVQYLQCGTCQCWENDTKGQIIGAKVIQTVGRGGHFRAGQVWLLEDKLSTKH